jgi:hypothetical protein
MTWFETNLNFINDLDRVYDYLNAGGFFTAPASTKYHGNYKGGLFDHSINVANTLFQLSCDLGLKWERPESPYIVGFFHDICKMDNYKKNAQGEYEYNKDTLFKGHGDKSLMLLSSLLQLTEEESACIRYHMGAFTDKEEWSDYTSAIHKYPNVLFTHTADMIATHIIEKGQ